MNQEKYSIKWHSYSDHLKITMKELMMNEDYSDVTLVTEDKGIIKANINILSTCSAVFKDILKKDKNSSPIMYLRGIQYSEMESIMQYIYLGEATFNEERMNEFLSVAKSLEIKGLFNAESESNVNTDDPSSCEQATRKDMLEEQNVISGPLTNAEEQSRGGATNIDTSTDSISDMSDSADIYKIARSIRLDPQLGQLSQPRVSKHLMNMAEPTWPAGRPANVNCKFECEQCHKTYSSKGALHKHKQAVHEGIKYVCDQCDYQAKKKENLTLHIQSKHQGFKYYCDQCDYIASRKIDIHTHFQGKHEGKFACNQCNYKASRTITLTEHIQSKHEGVKYSCDQCSFQASWKSILRNHKKMFHFRI